MDPELAGQCRDDSRDAANNIAVTLRVEINALHKAMLNTADEPTMENQFKSYTAAMKLASMANATAREMKDLYEFMKEHS